MRLIIFPRSFLIGWIAWILFTGAGLVALLRYNAMPGGMGVSPDRWPVTSCIRPEQGRSNLVLFAHPRCPCTRASLAELARIVALGQGRAAVHVVFFRPPDGDGRWTNSPNHRAASAIPGVRILDDPAGAEAARFGALTSGHMLVYDRDGRLRFSGGITRARGHQGDNAGRDAVVEFLTRGRSQRVETCVFGCPIFCSAQRATPEQ